MNIKNSILLRVRIAFVCISLFSIAIVARIIHIQTIQGARWKKQAQDRNISYRVVKATRGDIYSDNGSLLATSLPYYKVVMDPTAAKQELLDLDLDVFCRKLSAHFRDKSPAEYKRKIQNARKEGKKYLILNNKRINYQEKKMIASWPMAKVGRFKGGVMFEKIESRYLPFNFLARRTVGAINEENRGVGLEYTFNRQLGGRHGRAMFERISGGSWKPINDGTEIKPEPGLDIQTTIDINIQDVAEASLLRAVTEHQADYGCVVVMEVATGEIKAMANLGKTKDGGYGETFNYAVQGLTDPGSTFKLPTMIALLEDSNIEPTDSINTRNGELEYYNLVMRDSKPHGRITVQEAFEYSSNVGFLLMMKDHFVPQPQRYLDYLKAFGLTQPLGFQMRGEGRPYIKTLNDPTWSGITLPWMSVGYESRISPLHMLTFYNAVANNGRMIQPIIVKEIRNADEVLEKYEPMIINEKICSDKTLKKVRRMLEGVVEHGTAMNIRNNDYKIAGKTGTSQKIKNGRYTKSYYTSFIGYFPADKPKYSCAVVIDNPQGFKWSGADVAAPVFKDIADKVYARDIQMHKLLPQKVLAQKGTFPVLRSGYINDLQLICNELGISNHGQNSDVDWVEASPKSDAIVWKAKQTRDGFIPDVRGMTLKDALFVLENKGLRVTYNGQGRVASQSQPPGTRSLRGSVVYLALQ